ncbi:MAG: hypothetical protein AAF823_03110 [Planctomycetota bacterium]
MRFETFDSYVRQSGRFGQAYGYVRRQPSWAVRLALTVGVLVVVVPVMVLVLAATLAAAVVLLIAGTLARAWRWLTVGGSTGTPAARPRDDGRRNVRVIRR